MAEQVLRQQRVPGNKGLRYPADPPTVEEIVAVMREAGDGRSSARLRGLIVVLWRAGLRTARQLGDHRHGVRTADARDASECRPATRHAPAT
jgi:hypothetical protein